jgi:nucleotide-binding universal stress UspA family protein
MILIAYDGSADARAAIEHAGRQFPGQEVTVLSVWQRFADTVAHAGIGAGLGAAGITDYEAIDAESEQAAARRAAEGAQAATAAGLDARPETVALDSSVAEAILAEADRVSAAAIVIGSRGLTGIKSFLLGSVSNAVVHHADRPVVVVPSPEVARERLAHRGGSAG